MIRVVTGRGVKFTAVMVFAAFNFVAPASADLRVNPPAVTVRPRSPTLVLPKYWMNWSGRSVEPF
jgi:hypothetical protein